MSARENPQRFCPYTGNSGQRKPALSYVLGSAVLFISNHLVESLFRINGFVMKCVTTYLKWQHSFRKTIFNLFESPIF